MVISHCTWVFHALNILIYNILRIELFVNSKSLFIFGCSRFWDDFESGTYENMSAY